MVELEGPLRVSPSDLTAALSRALDQPVRARELPRGEWEAHFRAQGMRHPQTRMRMLDGFNEGWIRFEAAQGEVRRGEVGLEEVLRQLAARA